MRCNNVNEMCELYQIPLKIYGELHEKCAKMTKHNFFTIGQKSAEINKNNVFKTLAISTSKELEYGTFLIFMPLGISDI